MSTPNTPSGDPIYGYATPVPAPLTDASVSSVPPSPVPQLIQLAQPIESVPDQAQAPRPTTTLAPLLQPLRRGRPPKPKHALPPPVEHWQHVPQQQDGLHEAASAAPIVQQAPPQTELQLQYGRPPPEPAYVRGGHLLGGFNSARYSGNSTAHPRFNPGGRVILLTNASSLQPWVQQISHIAHSLSCFDELTRRFASFPQPCTVQLFICETRFATAFRILEGSISGPVWAYMRVLGYSSIPVACEGLMSPTPADCFEYAKLAASKMAVPGTPDQPAEERKRMVREVLTAQATDYPGERIYKKGIQWLRLACDNLIRQGDYELAESLYDPLPDWATKPPGYEESASSATTNGEGPSPDQKGGSVTPAMGAVNSPAPKELASTPAMPDPPKLVPEGQKSSKRKRTKKDVGPKPSKPGQPPAGADIAT